MEVFQCLFRGSVKNYEKPQSVLMITKYEGCSESNAPHFFFLETMYSECMKFMHTITGCFLYRCYFSTLSPSTSTALHQCKTRACMPSLYQLVSCSCSHVLTVRIMLSSSSNIVPHSTSFSGPKDENMMAPDQNYRGDGGAQSNQIW